MKLDGIEAGQRTVDMKEVITIDDEVHDIKGNGTLEEWNSGRMVFLKNHVPPTIPLFHHSISSALQIIQPLSIF